MIQVALFGGLLAIVIAVIVVLRRSTQRGTPEETRRAAAELSQWILSRRIWLALAGGGGLIALTGVAMWVHAMMGETVDVDLRALERGEQAPSSFVRVHGIARGDLAMCSGVGARTSCDTPLVSDPSATRAVVLLGGGRAFDGEGTFSGLATEIALGLPGRFEERGFSVGSDALVVVPGETPEERRPIGLVIAAIGLLLATIGGVRLKLLVGR